MMQCNDEPTENYHSNLHLSSLKSLLAPFTSLLWFCSKNVSVLIHVVPAAAAGKCVYRKGTDIFPLPCTKWQTEHVSNKLVNTVGQ